MTTEYTLIPHLNSNRSHRKGLTRRYNPLSRKYEHKDHTTFQCVRTSARAVDVKRAERLARKNLVSPV